MPCYHPLEGYRDIATGGWTASPTAGYSDFKMVIPCGQCIGCRLERARHWAVRCMHEARCHNDNIFLTLTYRDESLPPNNSLYKPHMTDFLKRLRWHIQPTKIRYLQCGEYGETTYRPHHHMVLFGYDFDDKELIRGGKHPLWRSDKLDSIWSHGHCAIGRVTFESAGYVARYTLDKITGPGADQYYEALGVEPPYMTMSRRPGLGAKFFDKYTSDMYPSDEVVVRGTVTCMPPKYYDRLLEVADPQLFTAMKKNRNKYQKDIDRDRLSVQNKCIELRLAQTKRKAL